MQKNNTILLGPKSESVQLQPILRKMAHLLIYNGTSEDFIEVYREIPAYKGKIRQAFLWRIYKKAKQENWTIEKLGNIMNIIG